MPTKPDTPTQGDTVIDVRDVSVHFALRGGSLARLVGRDSGTVKAVDGVTLRLHRGEVVGLVGESGSGKSTLGRALLGLVPATDGSIDFQGEDVARMSRAPAARDPPRHPDGLPGPQRGAQPRDDDRGGGRRRPAGARHEVGDRAPRAGHRRARTRRPLAGRALPRPSTRGISPAARSSGR